MNIFSSLRIYAMRSSSIYYSLQKWSGSVSRDLNESSWSCYPNGIKGFSFGDRLDAVIYISLAYLHRKIFFEQCPNDKILPIPEINNEYWNRIISASIEAQRLSSSKGSRYNELISELFGAVYDYQPWQSFIINTIGYFNDDDDETVKAFSFMFSNYNTYTDDISPQVKKLTKEEADLINQSKFYRFGVFEFILPKISENNCEEMPLIDKLYMRLFFPVWDKNNKYKQGDIVLFDCNSQVISTGNDACLILD